MLYESFQLMIEEGRVLDFIITNKFFIIIISFIIILVKLFSFLVQILTINTQRERPSSKIRKETMHFFNYAFIAKCFKGKFFQFKKH